MSRKALQPQEKNIARELESMRLSSKGKLIVTDHEGKTCAFLSAEGRLKAVTVLDEDTIGPDDIIIARIKDVKKDIGACFIEYLEGREGYLPLDRIPDSAKPKQGDLIPVRMTAGAQKGKRARFTAKIDYSKYENGDELLTKSSHLSRFNFLYRSDKALACRIRKVFGTSEYDEIITDDENMHGKLSDSFSNVRLYDDPSFPLSKLYSLESGLSQALSRQVWLDCGAYLVFDHTEAMTVIDVNSGKYIPPKSADKEQAVFKVNEEAAIEICRQLRLRNISGIIVIDFINLDDKKDQESLLMILEQESKNDTETITVHDITALGLIEITRKKDLPSLYEQIKK
ncbi:MAG: ribonuclease E/G [Lachnospiraceae bacterium]|nr:ribonuclease E/G [Lachnospiraceae bacterium]